MKQFTIGNVKLDELLYTRTDGRRDRPAISLALQRKGRGSFVYGDDQCKRNII